MAKLTKNQKATANKVDRNKLYTVEEAVKLLGECATAKFDESVEIAMNLGVDPRHADQMVRGTVALPNGTGKTVRVAVFAKGDAAEAAEKAGADIVGAEDLADKIMKTGEIDFDRVVAAPDCMAIVGKLGKILGPKGLMPNPKVGTVTPKPEKAVAEIKKGMVEFKVDKTAIVHCMIGKVSFGEEKVAENVTAFVEAIKAAKPSGAKGVYMKRATVSSTMGPGIKLDLSALN